MRLLWLAPLALFVLPAAATAPTGTPGVTLSPDSEQRWVGFDLTPGNQIRFEMLVDGKRATAILDTGVSFTVASQVFASRAGLTADATPPARADAIGGTVPIGWAKTRNLSFGGLTRTGGRMAVVDLKAIATASQRPVEILVGSDILGCCAIDIDFDARRFRMLPTGRLPFQGASAPMRLAPQSGVFLGEATIGGKRVHPLIVDTGDGSSLTIARGAWTATGLRPKAVTTAVAFGLGGTIETEVTILPTLALGAQPVREVEVRIEANKGFSDLTKTSGRIGSGLLQRFRVLLDPKAGHMVLSPGKRAGEAPIRSTSGLLVGHGDSRLRVLHVMRGSPAAAAGWRDGDQVCTVDDTPVPAVGGAGSVDTGWSAGSPGRTVRFGMCDGTERALTLASFY